MKSSRYDYVHIQQPEHPRSRLLKYGAGILAPIAMLAAACGQSSETSGSSAPEDDNNGTRVCVIYDGNHEQGHVNQTGEKIVVPDDQAANGIRKGDYTTQLGWCDPLVMVCAVGGDNKGEMSYTRRGEYAAQLWKTGDYSLDLTSCKNS